MDTSKLATSLAAAYRTFRTEQGTRNRQVNYRHIEGMMIGAAALMGCEMNDIASAVIGATDEADLALKLKALIV